jgi:hypothetical protein
MAMVSWGRREAGQHDPLTVNPVLLRRLATTGGRTSPWLAILLSLPSWPEPEVPLLLKPFLALAAVAFWLAMMILATQYAPPPGAWPVLPICLALLACGFVGGSVVAVLTAASYAALIYLGYLHLNLPEAAREMAAAGYQHRDLIMLLAFSWLCGAPRWRRRFPWPCAFCWGLALVLAFPAFILASIYIFYGQLPDVTAEGLLNRDFLLAWGVTVALAAVLAKLFSMAKAGLRWVCS